MNRKANRFLSFIVSAALVLSFIMIPAIPASANDEEVEKRDLQIQGNDFLADKMEDGNFYFYHPWSSDNIKESYKGISYDVKSNTLTINNANAPFLNIYIHGMSFLDVEPFTVNTIGTSKIGALVFAGASNVSFTGSGNLTINEPYSGTLNYNGVTEKVSNVNPSKYQFECDGSGITIRSMESAPKISVGKELTLTVYGSNDTKYYDLGGTAYDSDTDVAASIRFITSSDTKPSWKDSDLISYGGEIDPAFVWKSSENHTSVPSPDSVTVNYTYIEIPYDSLYFSEGTSGNFDISEDNLYVKYQDSYYAIQENIEASGWSISPSPLTLTSVSQNSTQSLSFSEGFPYDQNSGVLCLNQPVTSKYNKSNYLFHKDGKDYVHFCNTDIYSVMIRALAGIPDKTGSSASAYSYAQYKDNALLSMPTLLVLDDKSTSQAMVDNGFTCTMYDTFYKNVQLTNMKQTFYPKGSSGTSGGGGAAVKEPVVTDTKTDPVEEAPKAGDTVQKDDGDYKLTEDKSGKMTAEFSSNEKTDSQKTVTVPDVVEVNGEKVPVTSIADNAFSGNSKITNLKFKGKNLKKIGKNAFSKCKNLKQTVIPDSVTEIGAGAFDGDKKLGKITLNGNSLKKIGKNAFRGVKNNAKVTIKAKNDKIFKQVVKKIKKAGNKKLKFKFKKAKK